MRWPLYRHFEPETPCRHFNKVLVLDFGVDPKSCLSRVDVQATHWAKPCYTYLPSANVEGKVYQGGNQGDVRKVLLDILISNRYFWLLLSQKGTFTTPTSKGSSYHKS